MKQYETAAGSKQITDAFTYGQYGGMALVQPPYNLEQLARLPEYNTYHDNCIKAKANDTAGLGWEIKTAEDLKGEASPSQYDVLYGMLRKQWPVLTTVLVRAMLDYDTIGNGYLECGRLTAEAAVESIYHIPGHTVRAHQQGNKYCQQRGFKKVWFKRFGHDADVRKSDGKEYPIGTLEETERANELIQLASYTPRSDRYGVPDALTAIGAVMGSIAARDYNIKFFSNFGVPAYAVFITGEYDLGALGDDGEYEVVRYVKSFFADLSSRPHSTMVLAVPSETGGEVKVEVKPLAVEVKDASFRLYRKDNRDEIISAHRVPPYRVGIAETGSLGGSTAVESTKIYIESIINPRQEMIEQHFDHLILPTLGITDWRFQLKELDTSQEEHDKEIAEFLFKNGAMRPNDLIRSFGTRFGLEPDEANPALNAHFVDGKVSEALLQGAPPAAAAKEAMMIQSIKSLHDRLVDIATKSVGHDE